MANWLVLDVKNIPGATLSDGNASVQFGSGAWLPLTPTLAHPNLFQIEIPNGTSHINVRVEANHYWPAVQRFHFIPGPPPRLEFHGRQHINVGLPMTYSRDASNWVVHLPIVMGQLRDGQDRIPLSSFPLNPTNIDLATHPCLGDPPVAGHANFSNQTPFYGVTPSGTLHILERSAAGPPLIAVWQPNDVTFFNWANSGDGLWDQRGRTPIGYHMFFPPNPRNPWRTDLQYTDFLQRHLLIPQGFEQPNGKGMIYQHAVAAAESGHRMPIFVLPIKLHGTDIGNLHTKSGAFRLLLEINYWLQRNAGLPITTHPIGRVALSGFSFGGSHIHHLLTSGRHRLFDSHLKEIYGFDLVWRPAIEAIRRWYNRGRSEHMMRIYTGRAAWSSLLSEVGPATRRFGAAVAHNMTGSVVFAPYDFWIRVRPPAPNSSIAARAEWMHQLFPAYYMAHALTQSGFN